MTESATIHQKAAITQIKTETESVITTAVTAAIAVKAIIAAEKTVETLREKDAAADDDC